MRSSRATTVALAVLGALCPAGAEASPSAAPIKDTAHEETLRQRLAQLTAQPSATAEAAALVERYQLLLEALQATRRWQERVRELEREARDWPRLLLEARERLARPAPPPRPEAKADLDELRLALAQAQAEQAAAEAEQQELARQRERLHERRGQLPGLTAAAGRRLAEIEQQPQPNGAPAAELAQVERELAAARRRAAQVELAALEAEQRGFEGHSALLRARAELAERRGQELATHERELRQQVEHYQRQRADQEFERLELQLVTFQDRPRVERAVLLETRDLARERAGEQGTVARLEALRQRMSATQDQLLELRRRAAQVSERLTTIGLTPVMGHLLRRERATLPDLGHLAAAIAARKEQIAAVQLRLVELEERRATLPASDRAVLAELERYGALARELRVPAPAQQVEPTLRERRAALEALLEDHNTLFYALVDLDTAERTVRDEAHAFAALCERHVLWTPSSSAVRLEDFERLLAVALPALVAEASALRAQLWTRPWSSLTALAAIVLFFVALLAARRPLRARLARLAEATPPQAATAERVPLAAYLLTLAAALPVPLTLAALGLQAALLGGELLAAVARALQAGALLALSLLVLREALADGGLSDRFQLGSASARRRTRRPLTVLLVAGLPLVMLAVALEQLPSDALRASVGRLAFIALMLLVAACLHPLLRPSGPVAERLTQPLSQLGRWRATVRGLIWTGGEAGALALAALAAAGYLYTAQALAWRMLAQVWLAVGLVALAGLATRWLQAGQRHLARRHEAAQGGAQPAPPEPGGAAPAVLSIAVPPLARALFLGGLAIGSYAIWIGVLPALGFLRTIRLWSSAPAGPRGLVSPGSPGGALASAVDSAVTMITLADVLVALLVGVLTYLAARHIPAVIELLLLQRLPLTRGGRYALSTLLRYLLVLIGAVLAFGLLGLSWSSVQWLVAAMTVGLGFGLQEIFANFVSGLIMLFEQPVRVGDVVTVGDVEGAVARIHMRATTITTWDNKELIVPNKEFITGRLINWTLTDRVVRLSIPVGIAYGSDTALAERLLLESAARTPNIAAQPKPYALFSAFGESSLEFVLRVHVTSVDHLVSTRHALHLGIDRAFREAGIEIAFPQRDLRLRSIDPSVAEVLRRANAPGFQERSHEPGGSHVVPPGQSVTPDALSR